MGGELLHRPILSRKFVVGQNRDPLFKQLREEFRAVAFPIKDDGEPMSAGSSANRCSISAVFGAVFSNHGITSWPSVAIRPGSTSLLTYRNGWPSMAFTQ